MTRTKGGKAILNSGRHAVREGEATAPRKLPHLRCPLVRVMGHRARLHPQPQNLLSPPDPLFFQLLTRSPVICHPRGHLPFRPSMAAAGVFRFWRRQHGIKRSTATKWMKTSRTAERLW